MKIQKQNILSIKTFLMIKKGDKKMLKKFHGHKQVYKSKSSINTQFLRPTREKKNNLKGNERKIGSRCDQYHHF